MKLLAMKHRMIGLFAVFLPLALLGALVPTAKETHGAQKAAAPAITTPIITAPATRLTRPTEPTPAPVRATAPAAVVVKKDAA